MLRALKQGLISGCGLTDVGRVRNNNEDAFSMILEKGFFAVADGIGGHRAGEVAAHSVIRIVSTMIECAAPFESISRAAHGLGEAINAANRYVWEQSFSDPSFRGMGTTLCCFLIWHGKLLCANVGDSRLYRWRHELKLLTRDHCIYHPAGRKQGLTKAIGTHAVIVPDIAYWSVSKEDIYILCSDGLSDYVCDQEMALILREFGSSILPELCQKLVARALRRGGGDNITVLLAKVSA